MNHPDTVLYDNHPLLRWGTTSEPTLDTWTGVHVELVNDKHVVTKLLLSSWQAAGPHPGEIPGITMIVLNHNLLSGELPTWIYSAPDLLQYSPAYNYFSGELRAFNTPKLRTLHLSGNDFSGPIPDFDFASMPDLVELSLTGNNFSPSPIPASWSGLADGRGIQHVQVHSMGATGTFPAWVSNLKFSDSYWPNFKNQLESHRLGFSGNSFCFPSDFQQLPTFETVSGKTARVLFSIGANHCPTGQPAYYNFITEQPKNLNIRWETVDDAGNPTTDNPTGLKVTWDRPSGATGEIRYLVGVHLLESSQDNTQDDIFNYYINCPGWTVSAVTDPTTDEEISATLTRKNCDDRMSGVTSSTVFNPDLYLPLVSIYTTNGSTMMSSDAGFSLDWSIYIVADSQKTVRNVADVLNMRQWYKAWRWDAANDVWLRNFHNTNKLPVPSLEPGAILAIRARAPVTWLSRAGLSTADEDTPVQFQNGWNPISAGGSATRGVNEDGAFFIDDSLTDCNYLNGAVVIMRHNPSYNTFDVEFPCHPSYEERFTSGQSFGTIDRIDELDTLFIYYRSPLPVTIVWDAANSKYIAAN